MPGSGPKGDGRLGEDDENPVGRAGHFDGAKGTVPPMRVVDVAMEIRAGPEPGAAAVKQDVAPANIDNRRDDGGDQ
jgi:hypothetical protein